MHILPKANLVCNVSTVYADVITKKVTKVHAYLFIYLLQARPYISFGIYSVLLH